jgi:hypothetical protein
MIHPLIDMMFQTEVAPAYASNVFPVELEGERLRNQLLHDDDDILGIIKMFLKVVN